jgi:hypothetical protein
MLYQRHGWDIHALSTWPERGGGGHHVDGASDGGCCQRAVSRPFLLRHPWQAGIGTTPNPRRLNIGQLTDVSFCKLQQYF